MTPEERAQQALDKWVRDMNEVAMSSNDPAYLERLKRNYTESRFVADAMLAVAAQAIRDAKAEAYEEAIRATCPDCRNGVPVKSVFCTPPVSERAYEVQHNHEDGRWTECAAASVHILFASLVETVPS